jgi:hypothetical protein
MSLDARLVLEELCPFPTSPFADGETMNVNDIGTDPLSRAIAHIKPFLSLVRLFVVAIPYAVPHRRLRADLPHLLGA